MASSQHSGKVNYPLMSNEKMEHSSDNAIVLESIVIRNTSFYKCPYPLLTLNFNYNITLLGVHLKMMYCKLQKCISFFLKTSKGGHRN